MSARRRASAIGAALVVGLGAIVTAAYLYLQSSRQPRDGQIEVAGLSDRVEIDFDDWAIPTISGRSLADAAFAQGFVHASERLWQMELFQRIARGRLAEMFGEALLDTDRLLRTLDLWTPSEAEWATLAGEPRAVLEAYATGVNERLRTWRGPWPPEFLILGIEPQAWSPEASVAIGRIMSLDLSGWRTELARASTRARLPADRRDALFAPYPAWGPTIVQDDHATALADRSGSMRASRPAFPSVARSWTSSPDRVDPFAFLAGFAFHGSNSWAARGSRTADGHPLLANDMHLSLRAPSTWYLNALRAETPEYAAAGLSIPGAPGVVVGLNRRLAWAFTNAMLDDADFVVESLNLDQTMYRDGDAWQPFEIREERSR
ncbi:MAG: penicillin acylase family protein, partial [Gemmatimonadetes bacterium]|nr:penicillin acylase family protein [Gemmatimonadota bacterium]